MWEAFISNLPQIITAVVTIALVWKYASKALILVKEVEELLSAIVVAFADRKLTQEELDKIIKEAKDIPTAVREMLSKKKE